MNGNKIEVFNSAEFGTVRTLETADGKVFFYGADIAKALGYSNARDALLRHCKRDGVVKHDIIDSMGRTQQAKFITEGNVYRLIAHSKLSNAISIHALCERTKNNFLRLRFYIQYDSIVKPHILTFQVVGTLFLYQFNNITKKFFVNRHKRINFNFI